MRTQEQIKADLDRYCKAMIHMDGHSVCVAIEQRYDLYGYPPAIVCGALSAGAHGEDMDAAIDRLLENE